MNLTDNYQIDLNSYLKLYFSDNKTQMGTILSCGKQINFQLDVEMRKDRTGTIIRFKGDEKDKFIQEILASSYQKNKIYRLQPELSNQHKGFLYKAGIFFYEGHLSGYSNMQENGRLVLFHRDIQYQGSFRDNQFHGSGILTNNKNNIIVQGKWDKGFPKELAIQSNNHNQNLLLLKPLLQQPSEFPSLLSGLITYSDKRKYQGIFTYDEIKREYTITGPGKLEYDNGDTFEGNFVEGNLNGSGLFVSKRGTYKGQFKDGKFSGKGEFLYPDGRRLTITWIDNKPHGGGTLTLGQYEVIVRYQCGKRVPTLPSPQNC